LKAVASALVYGFGYGDLERIAAATSVNDVLPVTLQGSGRGQLERV
jgi:hypothetical protein